MSGAWIALPVENELKDMAARWAVAQARDTGPCQEEEAVLFAVQDLAARPELLWAFILHAEPLCVAPQARDMLSAGPLEELVQGYGREYIDRIESQARHSASFAKLLTGVWVPAGHDPVTLRYLALGCDPVRTST